MLFPLQCYICNESARNLSIWHLGFFGLLSNKVYGLQSFITWSQCVEHTSMVADASQLVLLSAAAIIRWEVFFFLGYVLGYTHRADFWINELAQVFNFGFHFMGLFFFFLQSQFYYINFESVSPDMRTVKLSISNDLNTKKKMPLTVWHKDVK